MAFESSPGKELNASDIFQCRQCGDCCRGFGGTLLTERDVQVISDYLEMAPDDFIRTSCIESDFGLVLAQGDDGYCRFAENALCRIHPVKPRMCRAWPFIGGVLRDPGNWQIMAGACPGIRTDVPEEAIVRIVRAELAEREASGG
jgi:Fe-S-cluster containining protein